MAQNLATKYSKKVDERFSLLSLTENVMNKDYDWNGVDTVVIYGVDTVAMGDYKRAGNNRYGTPDDLGTTTQTMKLTKDRAFTYVIDKGNHIQSEMVTEAGKALARQIRERQVPEVDMYRLEKMVIAAVANGATSNTALTKNNAYEAFLAGTEWMGDHKILNGYVAFVTTKFYNLIKQDPAFIKASDMGQKVAFNGQVGEIDGCPIIKVPSAYMPAKVPFVIIHKSVMVSPKQLAEHKTHDNPPGINGWLTEGRIIYDAFVRDQKKDGIYAHVEGIGDLTATLVKGTSGTAVATVGNYNNNGHKLVYNVATTSSAKLPGLGEDVTSYTDLVIGADIAATSTQSVVIVEADENGKALKGVIAAAVL